MGTETGTSGEETQRVLEVRLERDSHAPSKARKSLETLRPRIEPPLLEDLKLLVSELVTNSVQHGGPDLDTWIDLRLQLSGAAVRAEVTNPGHGFRHHHGPPGHGQQSGRGLYLVDLLADRWGVSNNDVTRVWFEIGASRQEERREEPWSR